MPRPDSNNTPRALVLAYSTKSAGLALRASLLKAPPEGVGFHPSQTGTLISACGDGRASCVPSMVRVVAWRARERPRSGPRGCVRILGVRETPSTPRSHRLSAGHGDG